MNVRDIIEHLGTIPQDMEVWCTWDESGEYWPVESPQGRIDWVLQVTRHGKTRWEKSENKGEGKTVCVLLSNADLTGSLKPGKGQDGNDKRGG